MTIALRSAALATALLLAAAPAQARDLCFYSLGGDPAVFVVAQSFSLPRRGKCRPIVGWDAGFYASAYPRPASGTACLDSAGSTLHVGVTIHATYVERPPLFSGEEQLQVYMSLPYPALSGGSVYLRANLPPLIANRTDGIAGSCGLTTLPIP